MSRTEKWRNCTWKKRNFLNYWNSLRTFVPWLQWIKLWTSFSDESLLENLNWSHLHLLKRFVYAKPLELDTNLLKVLGTPNYYVITKLWNFVPPPFPWSFALVQFLLPFPLHQTENFTLTLPPHIKIGFMIF